MSHSPKGLGVWVPTGSGPWGPKHSASRIASGPPAPHQVPEVPPGAAVVGGVLVLVALAVHLAGQSTSRRAASSS